MGVSLRPHGLFFRRLVVAAVLGIAVLALAWLYAEPAHADEVTPPVNLGSAGLTLDLRLWHYTAGAWSAASTSGITCTDLDTGEYVCEGLPTATGSERYTLLLAADTDPEAALAEYAYGAVPGQQLVWRQEIVLPSTPLVFKQHDTYGTLSLDVTRGLPSAACDGDTTATVAVWDVGGEAALFSGRAATITNCVTDVPTGTKGARLSYDWAAGGLETAGDRQAEFTICYSVDSCHTLPANNKLAFRVVPDFDGE